MPPNGVAPLEVSLTVAGQASNAVPFSYQVVASACDAKKMKAVGSLSTCIDNVYIKAVKKGLDPDVEALATCTEKFTASCTKAETKLDDCTRVDTCAETIAAVVPEFVETVWNKQCVEKDTVVRLCDEH